MRTNNFYRTQTSLRRGSLFDRLFENGIKIFIGVVAAIVILGGIGSVIFNATQMTGETTATCHVTEKNYSTSTDSDGNSHGVYRVATSDCGVFEIQDNILHGKFDSADTYYAIQTGHTYEMTYTGKRIPFLSQFPRILSVREVNA